MGKFINLQPGQKPADLDKNKEFELQNSHSYRSLLSKTFNATHINFSYGGSSNARQFRFAAQYFLGPRLILPVGPRRQQKIENFEIFREDNRPKYVFWFITSTARIENYNPITQEFDNEFLTNPTSALSKLILAKYYNHDYELEKLAQQMELWNAYFAQHNIKNVWIDTFNHHAYPINVENRLNFQTNYSDLMSNMCLLSGFNKFEDNELYDVHNSVWEADDPRSMHLKDRELLNPHTLHPTIKGHKLITDILAPKVVDHFGFVKYNQINE